MKTRGEKDIFLIEDHHEALRIWNGRGARGLTLIHLDAHIDFAFPSVKDTELAFSEARNIAELKAELEKSILFRRKQLELEKLTNIGNYIYPAMRDGIVNAFYWVIPGDIAEFNLSLKLLKGLLKGLSLRDPRPVKGLVIRDGLIKTSLYGKDFFVCCLMRLPRVEKRCLLDIDTDFLLIDSLRKSNNTDEIGKRKPWIYPDALVRILKKKVRPPAITTIAYSVNGGYTPMAYKDFGDRIARSLGARGADLERRLLAADSFRNFRNYLEAKDVDTARIYYKRAASLNPLYKAADNNYGALYARLNMKKEAIREFSRMLAIDRNHTASLAGLGAILLAEKKYRRAGDYFSRALRLEPGNKEAIIGLANTEFILKNYAAARRLYLRYIPLDPMHGVSRLRLGLICERKNQAERAFQYYEDAMQLGVNDAWLLRRLIKLSRRFDMGKLDYLRKRMEEFKKGLARMRRLKKRALIRRNN